MLIEAESVMHRNRFTGITWREERQENWRWAAVGSFDGALYSLLSALLLFTLCSFALLFALFSLLFAICPEKLH